MRSSALVMVAGLFLACSGAEVATTCNPGEKSCEGSTLRTCNADGTGYTETVCELGCSAGACVVCTAGQSRCEGQVSLTCNMDGSGWTQQSCQSGCDPATGQCKTQVCVPNQSQCSAGSVMTCKPDGSGYTVTPCEYGCDQTTNQCIQTACTPGTTTCNGPKLITCKTDGTGITEQLCPYGCDPAAVPPACKPAACNVGDKRCNPTEPKQVQICAQDQSGWVNSTICPGTCLNGECVAPANCTPGEEVCRRNVDYHRDEIDLCNASGQWDMGAEVCTTGSCYDAGGTPKQFSCGTCWIGERACVGQDVMECSDPSAGATKLYSCSGDADECVAGSCAWVIDLVGDATENHNILIQAFVDCWFIYLDATQNEMCFVIDGTAAPFPQNFDDMKDWVCDLDCDDPNDQDFFDFGQEDCEMARELVGCGLFDNSEIYWLWDPLPAATNLEACIWYHPYSCSPFWCDDQDTLDHCENFWATPPE